MSQQPVIYRIETPKSVQEYVRGFSHLVKANGFIINNEETMNMKETFRAHGRAIPDDFDLQMIQICKPDKADKSLTTNPERAVLMPKFVHVFTKDHRTQVRFLGFPQELIAALVPEDAAFPTSLEETFKTIRFMIDEAG